MPRYHISYPWLTGGRNCLNQGQPWVMKGTELAGSTFSTPWLLCLVDMSLGSFSLFLFVCMYSTEGEGNGNPLQCSCLENPRDRGAWWAAIYGVTQSWTRLRWLSSSSMHIFIILGSNLSVFYSTLEWIESLSSNDKERNNCLYSVELRTKIVNSKKYTVVLYLFCCCWKFGSELHWI